VLHLFYLQEPIEVRFVRRDDAHSTLRIFRRIGGGREDADDESDADGRPLVGSVLMDAPADRRLSSSHVYMAISKHFFEDLRAFLRREGSPSIVKMISIAAASAALERFPLPPKLGYLRTSGSPFVPLEAQLARLPRIEKRPARIALINMFNPAYGDCIMSAAPLRQFKRRLDARFGASEIDLIQHPDNVETSELYFRSGLIRAIRHLPAPVSILQEYDGYIDLSAERLRSDIHWVDAFLEALGIDFATIDENEKRNRLAISVDAHRELGARVDALHARGKPLLLFHPLASTRLRAFPPHVTASFVEEVLERTDWEIMTAVPLPVRHERITDFSDASRTFDHLVYLISRATMFVCADTCVYHVADAFDVPGVAIFTSIDPQCRIAYYPYVAGVALQEHDNPLLGTHWSEETEDVSIAQAMWRNLDVDRVLDALASSMRKRYGDAGTDVLPPEQIASLFDNHRAWNGRAAAAAP
jgi:hypothetical protein